MIYFCYLSSKIYVVGTQQNCLNETVLLSTYNITVHALTKLRYQNKKSSKFYSSGLWTCDIWTQPSSFFLDDKQKLNAWKWYIINILFADCLFVSMTHNVASDVYLLHWNIILVWGNGQLSLKEHGLIYKFSSKAISLVMSWQYFMMDFFQNSTTLLSLFMNKNDGTQSINQNLNFVSWLLFFNRKMIFGVKKKFNIFFRYKHFFVCFHNYDIENRTIFWTLVWKIFMHYV